VAGFQISIAPAARNRHQTGQASEISSGIRNIVKRSLPAGEGGVREK
jgi:hypothetical protein